MKNTLTRFAPWTSANLGRNRSHRRHPKIPEDGALDPLTQVISVFLSALAGGVDHALHNGQEIIRFLGMAQTACEFRGVDNLSDSGTHLPPGGLYVADQTIEFLAHIRL